MRYFLFIMSPAPPNPNTQSHLNVSRSRRECGAVFCSCKLHHNSVHSSTPLSFLSNHNFSHYPAARVLFITKFINVHFRSGTTRATHTTNPTTKGRDEGTVFNHGLLTGLAVGGGILLFLVLIVIAIAVCLVCRKRPISRG